MRPANKLKQKKTSLERIRQLSEVALIVGGGPGISASCARLFTQEGMKVAVAARNPEKSVMKRLAEDYGVACYGCDAREPELHIGRTLEALAEAARKQRAHHVWP